MGDCASVTSPALSWNPSRGANPGICPVADSQEGRQKPAPRPLPGQHSRQAQSSPYNCSRLPHISLGKRHRTSLTVEAFQGAGPAWTRHLRDMHVTTAGLRDTHVPTLGRCSRSQRTRSTASSSEPLPPLALSHRRQPKRGRDDDSPVGQRNGRRSRFRGQRPDMQVARTGSSLGTSRVRRWSQAVRLSSVRLRTIDAIRRH